MMIPDYGLAFIYVAVENNQPAAVLLKNSNLFNFNNLCKLPE